MRSIFRPIRPIDSCETTFRCGRSVKQIPVANNERHDKRCRWSPISDLCAPRSDVPIPVYLRVIANGHLIWWRRRRREFGGMRIYIPDPKQSPRLSRIAEEGEIQEITGDNLRLRRNYRCPNGDCVDKSAFPRYLGRSALFRSGRSTFDRANITQPFVSF